MVRARATSLATIMAVGAWPTSVSAAPPVEADERVEVGADEAIDDTPPVQSPRSSPATQDASSSDHGQDPTDESHEAAATDPALGDETDDADTDVESSHGPPDEPEFGDEGVAPEPDFGDGGDGEGPPPEPDFGEPDFDEPAGPPPEPDLGEDTDYDPLRDSPQWAKARGWSRAGIVALSTGGVLLIGAIAMGTSDPGAFGTGNNNFVDARDRAALLMGVPAGMLIAGGAAMLGYGQSKKNKLRLEFQSDGASVRVGVHGRF